MDAQRVELLERIKVEVRAIAAKERENVRRAGEWALTGATIALDNLLAGYEAVIENMPLDLLEVAKAGGHVAVSEWKDANGIFQVAMHDGIYNPCLRTGLCNSPSLPKGDYRVFLVVMPIAKAEGK